MTEEALSIWTKNVQAFHLSACCSLMSLGLSVSFYLWPYVPCFEISIVSLTSISPACRVQYKRAVWDRIGWDEHDSLLGCTLLMIIDIGMTIWLFCGCVCNANEAVFFILCFVTVIVKAISSMLHMYHFDIFRHLTLGVESTESFSRNVIQSPYSRTATRDSPDNSPKGGGSSSPAIRRGSIPTQQHRQQEIPTVTPVYSTPPRNSSSV